MVSNIEETANGTIISGLITNIKHLSYLFLTI